MQCVRFCIVFIVNVIALIIVVIIISMIIITRIIIINLLEVYLQPAAARMHTGLPRRQRSLNEPPNTAESGVHFSAGYTNSNGGPNELNWLLEDLHTLCVCVPIFGLYSGDASRT